MAVRSPTLPQRYGDVRPIGRGGMADIFRATDAELGRAVAVKVLADHCAEDEDIRARFLWEGRAAARLAGDPNTVTIYDVGEADGRPYIVMEYLPGGSLATRLAAGRIEPALALDWLEQAACALDTAHERGVVHRDVKPGNLLLDEDDNVYVADFGIARAADVDSNTQTGVILGTAGYLAPEQATGLPATPASDEYALAVVAHELLTGARPGPTPSSKLPPAAHGVFARALAERPEERYPSCLDLVAALRSALAPSPALAPTAVTRAFRTRRRSRRLPLTLAALLLGLLAFLLTAVLSSGHASSPPTTIVQTVTVPAPRARTQPAQPVAAQSGSPVVSAEERGKGHGKHKGREKHHGD